MSDFNAVITFGGKTITVDYDDYQKALRAPVKAISILELVGFPDVTAEKVAKVMQKTPLIDEESTVRTSTIPRNDDARKAAAIKFNNACKADTSRGAQAKAAKECGFPTGTTQTLIKWVVKYIDNSNDWLPAFRTEKNLKALKERLGAAKPAKVAQR